MELKNAYWFRIDANENTCHVAIIADTLDEAFEIAEEFYKVDAMAIHYRNREIDTLEKVKVK